MKRRGKPKRIDFDFVRGDTFEYVFSIRRNGVKQPLSGFSFEGDARRIDSDDVLFNYTFTLVSDVDCRVSVSPATSAAVPQDVKLFRHRWKFTSPSGAVRTWLFGNSRVRGDSDE